MCFLSLGQRVACDCSRFGQRHAELGRSGEQVPRLWRTGNQQEGHSRGVKSTSLQVTPWTTTDLLHMRHQEEYCNLIVISYSGAPSRPRVPRHCYRSNVIYLSYLRVKDGSHRTAVSSMENFSSVLWPRQRVFKRENVTRSLSSVGGCFHHSRDQADWIEIFNNINKNSQHLLDTSIPLWCFLSGFQRFTNWAT